MTEGKRPLSMRTMTVGDIPGILEIEKLSFVSPWTRGMFVQTLESQVSHNFIVTEGQRILGYLIFYQAALEMHIMNIAVHPGRRRQGIARAMLEKVLEAARGNSIEECFLEVRESNFAARTLYKKLGFKSIGKRKGYYSETNEDAIVMVLSLDVNRKT